MGPEERLFRARQSWPVYAIFAFSVIARRDPDPRQPLAAPRCGDLGVHVDEAEQAARIAEAEEQAGCSRNCLGQSWAKVPAEA